MVQKAGIGKSLTNGNYLGRSAFFLALSAFLISVYLVFPQLALFLKLYDWDVSDWLVFFQLLVFLTSAYIAYSTITTSKATARERATLDTILDDNKDEELYDSKILIYDFHKNPDAYFLQKNDIESKRKSLSQLFEVEGSQLTQNEHDVRKHLIKVLNRHEFYAVGINNELLDESLFKRMHCSNIVRLWETVNPAVTQLRAQAKKDTLFKELEFLAVRWKACPLRIEDIK